jgi:tetratricopeptide (TPR) repeat protein
LGDSERALSEYLKALNTTPDFAAGYYNAARLYSKMGDLDQCIQYLEKAAELEPGWREEAAEDDSLSWVLRLHRLRQDRRGRS